VLTKHAGRTEPTPKVYQVNVKKKTKNSMIIKGTCQKKTKNKKTKNKKTKNGMAAWRGRVWRGWN